MAEPVRIFVGADRSQLLAVRVLEHSIRRHTALPIETVSMHDLAMPEPRDPRNWARTGFSFSRFAIPALCSHAGRAIYLDADMLVFDDIAELWHMPFDGAKVLVQGEPGGAPKRRKKQCSVMVLDCGALDWQLRPIVAGLDGAYDYEALMSELCILEEAEIGAVLPLQWNSLERYVAGETRLLHYTDMDTQPWVSPENPLGYLWLGELRRMHEAGVVGRAEIVSEIAAGHLRPSLLAELEERDHSGPPPPAAVARYVAQDRDAGFVGHAALMAKLERRKAAIRARSKPHPLGGLLDRLQAVSRKVF